MATSNWRFFAYERGDDTYTDIPAEVYLDDELIGTTPVDPAISLEIKEYTVEFRKNLWRLVHFKWTPSEEGGFHSQQMVRKQRVRFESTPEGAEVSVNGVVQGTTPLGILMNPKMTWDTTPYNILMTKEGYEDYTATLYIREPAEPGEKEPIIVSETLEEEPEPKPETFTVSIMVVDENNNPLEGCTIGISDNFMNTVATLTTDSTGAASTTLEEANYDFYLAKAGYTWTDTTMGFVRIGVDEDKTISWVMEEEAPPPPPPPLPQQLTWFDPEYWHDEFGIDIGEIPELTLKKNIVPGWDLFDYSGDENDYLSDPDGNLFVRDTSDIVQNAFESFMTKISTTLGITTPAKAELRGRWLDGSDTIYMWSDNKNNLQEFAVAEMGLGGGRMVAGAISRIAAFLKNARGMPKKAFKFNKKTGKFEVISTVAAGVYILGTLTGTSARILDTTLKIIGPAIITEWAEIEGVGIAYMGVWAARDLGAEPYEQAIVACEKTLIAGRAAHAIVGKIPVFSDIIGTYLDTIDTNLFVARADLARKKGAESPFINWILAGNRTTVSVEVERVIDGDTIDIKKTLAGVTYDARVRLLGIDTPEKFSAAGEKSLNYLRSLLEGSTITLKLDPGRIYGKYRRILAVVYAAGKCVQLDLLEKGYARVMIGADNLALDEIMPEDLPPGPHAHGILYYADKDFGWTAKLATFYLHGVEADADVDVEELPVKKVDVAHGGTYKILVGDEVKIARIKDRKTKDVTI